MSSTLKVLSLELLLDRHYINTETFRHPSSSCNSRWETRLAVITQMDVNLKKHNLLFSIIMTYIWTWI